ALSCLLPDEQSLPPARRDASRKHCRGHASSERHFCTDVQPMASAVRPRLRKAIPLGCPGKGKPPSRAVPLHRSESRPGRDLRAPQQWPWSSYRATVGVAPCPPFLTTDATLGLFTEDPEQARERFAEF